MIGGQVVKGWRLSVAAPLVVAVLALSGCGGGSDGGGDVSRDDLIDALMQPDTAALDKATAECVADGLLDAGLTQAELQEFADGAERPSALSAYTTARLDCDDLP